MRSRSAEFRGYTLLEALVAGTLLLVVFGSVFYFFSVGARGFSIGASQSETLSDFQAFARLVKRDLELTHYYSVSVVNRTAETSRGTVNRQGLSLAGLSDWGDDTHFEDATGLPKWDRWILFYANREDVGRLFRVEFARRPGAGGNYYPLRPRGADDLIPLMVGNPASLPGSLKSQSISRNVHAFAAKPDDAHQSIEIEFTTYANPSLRMTSQARDEEFKETRVVVVPLNTYPPI